MFCSGEKVWSGNISLWSYRPAVGRKCETDTDNERDFNQQNGLL
jgi:hypothetical protein